MKPLLKFIVVVMVLVGGAIGLFLAPMLIAERPRMNFQRNLKAKATAQQLHAWATGILAPYETNRDPRLWIEITNLPPAFQGLFKWAPSAYVYGDSQARFDTHEPVPYIKITYGAAAGHFGVLLGPKNLPTPTSREHEIRYTAWAPGAWFFDGQ
jgi:hypothetical protein